jgi:hypothetical protein
MRWLAAPLAGILASAFSLVVLYRLWRGHPIVLRGRLSSRVVRIVVIVMVGLGVGVERSPAQSGDDHVKDAPERDGQIADLPAAVNENVIRGWLRSCADPQGEQAVAGSHWQTFKSAFARFDAEGAAAARDELKWLPQELQAIVAVDLDARDAGKTAPPVSADFLLQALDAMEAHGLFDTWATAYVWRKASQVADRSALIPLFKRLQQHERITNALIKARAEVRPYVMPARAWMSKAGPSRRDRDLEAKGIREVFEAAKRLYPASDLGTWQKDGIVRLTVAAGSPRLTLVRGGQQCELQAGDVVRFNRLDLLVTPAGEKAVVVEDAWCGNLTPPIGRTLAVWDLPPLLSAAAVRDVQQTIELALNGDDEAVTRIERSLPLVQPMVREAIRDNPTAAGAPVLRLLIALFDDAVATPPESP